MLRIQANLNNFTHPLTCPINLHATFNFQQNDSLGRCPRQFLPRRWWRRRRAARSLRQKENVENDFGGAGGRPGGTPDNEMTTRDRRRVGRGGTVGPGVREEAGGDFFITFCEK